MCYYFARAKTAQSPCSRPCQLTHSTDLHPIQTNRPSVMDLILTPHLHRLFNTVQMPLHPLGPASWHYILKVYSSSVSMPILFSLNFNVKISTEEQEWWFARHCIPQKTSFLLLIHKSHFTFIYPGLPQLLFYTTALQMLTTCWLSEYGYTSMIKHVLSLTECHSQWKKGRITMMSSFIKKE